MNLFDVSDEEYASKSKIRLRDSSTLASKIAAEFVRQSSAESSDGGAASATITILDIGCGTGQSALELGIRFPNARVIGIDANPSYIESAPTMAKNVEFYCVDFCDTKNFGNFCAVTELSACTIDIAVSTYWLASLPIDTRTRALDIVNRLLRPDGHLYLLDLVWTDAYAIVHRLNQTEQWRSIIKSTPDSSSAASPVFQIDLPKSDSPPSNEQVSNEWIKQFEPFAAELELVQIVRNKLFYRFQSMDDMMHTLESICPTAAYIDDPGKWHEYFLQYIRATFDHCFIAANNLKLGYVNLLVVAQKRVETDLSTSAVSEASDNEILQ